MNSKKGLTEILQDLVDLARATSVQDVELKLALPEATIKAFSKRLQSIERVKPGYALDETDRKSDLIGKVWLVGGTVELESL